MHPAVDLRNVLRGLAFVLACVGMLVGGMSSALAQGYSAWAEVGPPPQSWVASVGEGQTAVQVAYCPAGALSLEECPLMLYGDAETVTCTAAAFGLAEDYETPICWTRYVLSGDEAACAPNTICVADAFIANWLVIGCWAAVFGVRLMVRRAAY